MVLVSSSIPVDVGDSYIRIMVGEEDALDKRVEAFRKHVE